MARGSKDKYTDKQKRQAEHIAEGYQDRGAGKKTAKARAWATVNKMTGGGKKKGGSGEGKPINKEPARKGGRKAAAGQPGSKRSEAAKKGWETRRKKAAQGKRTAKKTAKTSAKKQSKR
jgi:hypothetical protein